MTYPQQPPGPQPGQGYPGQPAPGPAWQPAPGQPGSGQPWQSAPGPAWPGGQAAPPYHQGAPQFGYATPGLAGPPGHPLAGPPPLSPTGEPLAEFSDRLLAWIIDGAILAAVSLGVMVPFMIVIITTMTDRMADMDPEHPDVGSTLFAVLGWYALLFLLLLAASYIYSVRMMFRTGQTVGKRVMKIRVATLDGQPLTHGAAAKRWGAMMLLGLVPAGQLIDGLWQLWDQPLRQCLHDKLASTVVVKLAPMGTTAGGMA